MRTVKILNEKSMKVHYADSLGSDHKFGEITNVYRLWCSREGIRIPIFLGSWAITESEEVNCGRCLKSKKEKKENDDEKDD